MITEVKASHYRSLGADVSVRLARLTALVGPNGAGKSNVIDLFQFLADAMQIGLEGAISKRGGIGRVRRFNATGRPFDLAISIQVSNTTFVGSYSFTLEGSQTEEYRVKSERALIAPRESDERVELLRRAGVWEHGPKDLRPDLDPLSLALPLLSGDSRFAPLARVLRGMAVYSIFPDTLRRPQDYDPRRPMDRHGSNWVSILKDLKASDWKPELLEALARLTGDVEDLRVRQAGGYLTVEFKHQFRSGKKKRLKWLDAAQQSDGTLRVAGILTALLQRPDLSLLGIEEPELTVHPGALPLIYDYIREASHQTQIVITTHSPDLLDHLKAEEIAVVEKRPEGQSTATRVTLMRERQREAVRKGLMTLGEVLRTEGIQQDLPTPEAE